MLHERIHHYFGGHTSGGFNPLLDLILVVGVAAFFLIRWVRRNRK